MLEILSIKVSDEITEDEINRQMILINSFISEQFNNLTAEEVKEAFKMYVARKLTDKVFRLIDCVAVGEILTSYIDYRNQTIEPFLIKRQALLNKPTEISDEAKQKLRLDFLKMVYEELKQKKYSYDSWMLFDYLEKSKKIVKTNKFKKEMYERELAKYKSSLKQEAFSKPKEIGVNIIKDVELKIMNNQPISVVQNTCRSILASEYLVNFIFDFDNFCNELKDY